MAKWGINIKMCHGTLTGSVIDFLSLSEGRWILIVMQIDGSYFILVNIFSFNKPDRMILLCYLLVLDKQRRLSSASCVQSSAFVAYPGRLRE